MRIIPQYLVWAVSLILMSQTFGADFEKNEVQLATTDGVHVKVSRSEVLRALRASVQSPFSSNSIEENSDGSFTIKNPKVTYNGTTYGMDAVELHAICKVFGFTEALSAGNGGITQLGRFRAQITSKGKIGTVGSSITDSLAWVRCI